MTDLRGIEEHGPNQGAWEGLQSGLAEGTVHHAGFIETIDARDYTSNIRFFAERAYDLIITIGPGVQDETAELAGEYPNIQFLALDQDHGQTAANVVVVAFPEDQMGYLAGAAAALTSRTGVVAAVCETSGIDSMWRYCEGFRRGADHVNPSVRTIVAHRDEGSSTLLFADPAWGQQAAIDAIRSGADVVFGVGGGTGQGALRAAAEAGAYAIGADQDQWYAVPEARPVLVTSVYADCETVVLDWVRRWHSGLDPTGADAARIKLAPFHDLEPLLPGETWEQLDAILNALQGGALETGVPENGP